MVFQGKSKEYLRLETIDKTNCTVLKERMESVLSLLWFTSEGTELIIDNQVHVFKKNQILCLTEFHSVDTKKVDELKMVRFNRPFYCVLHHQSEISCKGVLFFGAAQLPMFQIEEKDVEKFETLWRMFEMEMESKDGLQLDMLQMMLKRLLILCTRVYKEQNDFPEIEKTTIDVVREFNFLVEKHFHTKHTVAEYADMLNKSPKTISNVFAKLNSKKTPLQYIQDRRMVEARRLLMYTDKPVKEISYEIGYEDVQTFSRFFKKHQGVSPTEYKEKNQ